LTWWNLPQKISTCFQEGIYHFFPFYSHVINKVDLMHSLKKREIFVPVLSWKKSCWTIFIDKYLRSFFQYGISNGCFLLFASDETLCGDPEQPVSSVVKHLSSTEVEYNCVKGYKLEGGNRTRSCTPSGLWSGRTPRCTGIRYILRNQAWKKLKFLFQRFNVQIQHLLKMASSKCPISKGDMFMVHLPPITVIQDSFYGEMHPDCVLTMESGLVWIYISIMAGE